MICLRDKFMKEREFLLRMNCEQLKVLMNAAIDENIDEDSEVNDPAEIDDQGMNA